MRRRNTAIACFPKPVLGNAVVVTFVVPVAVETGDIGLTVPTTVVPVFLM